MSSRLVIALTFVISVLLAIAVACGTDASDVDRPASTATATSQLATTTTATTAVEPATPTVVPIQTTAPTPTVESDVGTAVEPTPVVTSEVAETAVRLAQEAWDQLVELTESHSPRASGTEQEAAAAEYLRGLFESMGYEASLQPFTFQTTETEAVVSAPVVSEYRAFPLRLSVRGEAEGTLVDVGGAFEDDLPSGGLTGKIALIERGTITFQEKVARVAEAGAIGAVIYNNEPGRFGGTFQTQSDIPAVSISREDGVELVEMVGAGEVEFRLSILEQSAPSQNVIADKPGTGDAMVILGGHYDTVPDVPGANDNGSGTATVLTLARELADGTFPFTLRFMLFGGEEEGLFGSRHYVQELNQAEQDRIIAMLNFDALGSGSVTAVLGSMELVDAALDYSDVSGIVLERRFTLGPGASSDHAPFDAARVPVLFFLADGVSRIHTPEDQLEFIQPERMGESAALAIGVLDLLAAAR